VPPQQSCPLEFQVCDEVSAPFGGRQINPLN